MLFVLFSVIRQSKLLFFLTTTLRFTRPSPVVPMEDCYGGVVRMLGATCVLTNLTASFLFLQRLRAVYTRNRRVQWVFFALWVAANGFMTTTMFGAVFGHIPGTTYCMYSHVHSYVSASGFVVAFFDTAVFIAISYNIAVLHGDFNRSGITWDTFISGRALPRLSKAVLRGGQQYYL